MLKYQDGKYLEMTAEEVADLNQMEEVQPSLEERIAILEALLAEKEAE